MRCFSGEFTTEEVLRISILFSFPWVGEFIVKILFELIF